jgi:cytochrome oxidase assembly protein ShyY1
VSSPSRADPRPARTTRQWIALGLSVAILVTGCIIAGRWQWNRHVARDAAIAIIETNYSSAPVQLDSVLPAVGSAVTERDVWRQASMHGHYVPEATVLLRNRPVDGQAAFQVLVPFVTDEGTVLVINRGWLPYGANSSEPDSIPSPPLGEVDVVVRLRADEPAAENGAPPGQVQAINTAQVLAAGPDGADWADGLTYSAYGALASETPAPVQAVNPLPTPDTDPRSHLSYAFQWWVFAAGGLIGFIILIRRDRRETTAAALGNVPHPFDVLDQRGAGATGPSTAIRPRRRPRTPSPEDIEDALIDSKSQH